ncbi:MAG: LacI family transcriptional regulator [Clostridiales bacterium]|nr:LacI family transcriptional regulator [Clostridiales bacterium]
MLTLKEVRIADVAKRAGVSAGTVSNALNGRPGVSAQQADRIRLIAREMGYPLPEDREDSRKNCIRLLIFKSHGLVVMDTQFFAELFEGIQEGCKEAGMELVVTNIHKGREENYLERIAAVKEERCAGILLLGTEMEREDLKLFTPCNSPLVVMDNLFFEEDVHSIVMNNFEAGRMAAEHLVMAGHKRMGCITGSAVLNNMSERQKGFFAALKAHGITMEEDDCYAVTPTMEGARRDLLHQTRGKTLPTAFFAANDIIAMGAMMAFREKGIRVPEDVSIIGMDDLDLCLVTSPQLTTIHVHRKEMGRSAVRMLLHSASPARKGCYLKSQLSVALRERGSVKHMEQKE